MGCVLKYRARRAIYVFARRDLLDRIAKEKIRAFQIPVNTMVHAYRLITGEDITASVKPAGEDMPANVAIFAIPPTLALMEEHVSMPSTPLFATVLKDIQENIVEMTSVRVVT